MILDRIVSHNRQELERKKRRLPLPVVERMATEQPPTIDLASALTGDGIKLIAEVKKASPSRGVIRPDFDPVKIAELYADNGAAAISVLTEARYFQGSLDHLTNIRKALLQKLPLLRKDFVVDPYQIYESRAYGADALLLIVAIMKPDTLKELLDLGHELSMNCLIEVHNEVEVEIALNSGAKIIGINNRDLNTFTVDLATTERLRPLIPKDKIVVSESGIKARSDVEMLRTSGIDAILVGEALMSAPDIASRMRDLL
jgi:indole-3-glycerol phosphate synthase